METELQTILPTLSGIRETVKRLKETVLAHLIFIGEIPAPTFHESKRIHVFVDRLEDAGLRECRVDDAGNGIGVIRGKNQKKNILVVAHADTVFEEQTSHGIRVLPDIVRGPGVADNGIGMAVLLSLPGLMREAGIELEGNLILAGVCHSLGRGNLTGLRHILSRTEWDVHAGLCVEGVQLGRLSHTCIGMRRGEIVCRIHEEYDGAGSKKGSAILTMNKVITRINNLQLSSHPRTAIIMGSLSGGSAYNTTPKKTVLRFEIRSESEDIVADINQKINKVVEQVADDTGDEIILDVFAERKSGEIPCTHPMVKAARTIMETLGVETQPVPSMSELSAFIDSGIPAVTLGLTRGRNIHHTDESIEIDPVFTGIAQVIGMIQAMDRGDCEQK